MYKSGLGTGMSSNNPNRDIIAVVFVYAFAEDGSFVFALFGRMMATAQ
jgi:hypothetical protein